MCNLTKHSHSQKVLNSNCDEQLVTFPFPAPVPSIRPAHPPIFRGAGLVAFHLAVPRFLLFKTLSRQKPEKSKEQHRKASSRASKETLLPHGMVAAPRAASVTFPSTGRVCRPVQSHSARRGVGKVATRPSVASFFIRIHHKTLAIHQWLGRSFTWGQASVSPPPPPPPRDSAHRNAWPSSAISFNICGFFPHRRCQMLLAAMHAGPPSPDRLIRPWRQRQRREEAQEARRGGAATIDTAARQSTTLRLATPRSA